MVQPGTPSGDIMKNLALGFFPFAFIIAATALAQSHVVTYDAASVAVDTITLSPMPDGGCWLAACGRVTNSDGDTQTTCVNGAPLQAPVNLSRCASLADRAAVRVAQVFRVDDGGTP